MKLVFCGTPQFAVPTLEAVIAAGHQVALVLTQPDRPVGRDQNCRLRQSSRRHSRTAFRCCSPKRSRTTPSFAPNSNPSLPTPSLSSPTDASFRSGCSTSRASGTSTSTAHCCRSIAELRPSSGPSRTGEVVTGVTTMRLDAGLDTGPMLLAQAIPVGEEETAVDVYENLAEVGAPLMVETLRRLEADEIFPEPQDHALATHAPILTRDDGRIDFNRTAREIHNRWRGFQPWPGAHTTLRGKKLIAHRLHSAQHETPLAPGIIHLHEGRLLVGCADSNVIELDEVQLEGKRRMSAAELLRGYQIHSGERLGE